MPKKKKNLRRYTDRRVTFVLHRLYDYRLKVGDEIRTMVGATPLASVVATNFSEAAEALGGHVWQNRKAQRELNLPIGHCMENSKPFLADTDMPVRPHGAKKHEDFGRLTNYWTRLVLTRVATVFAKPKAANEAAVETFSPLDRIRTTECLNYYSTTYMVLRYEDGYGGFKRVIHVYHGNHMPEESMSHLIPSAAERGLNVTLLGSGNFVVDRGRRTVTLLPRTLGGKADPNPAWTIWAWGEANPDFTFELLPDFARAG